VPKAIVNGVRVETTGEEISNLQQQASKQLQPITPLSGAIAGDTEDQSKMRGTKTQKEAAIKVATETPATLREEERTVQARQQTTAPEQLALERAKQIRQFGYLGSRIDDIIQQRFTKQAAPVPVEEGVTSLPTLQLTLNEQQISADIPAENQETFKTTLNQYQTAVNAGDQAGANQALVTLQGLSGGKITSPQDITSKYLQSTAQSTAQQVAGQVAGDIKLAEVGAESLGLSNEELTSLLGPEWGNLTVPQLKDSIANLRSQELNRSQQLQTELSDAATSPARRAEIYRELKDLSQVGIYTAEQQVKNIEQEVDSANTVLVGDQEYTISSLLNDENITKMVENYLALPEGAPGKTELEQQFGGAFTDWINSHKNALQEITGKQELTADQFTTLQESNTAAKSTEVGDISDQLLKNMGIDTSSWAAADFKATLESQAWYQTLQNQDIPVEDRTQFLNILNSKELDPEFAQEIAELPPQEVTELIKNPKGFADYVAYRTSLANPSEFTPEQSQNLDFLLDYMYGKDVSTEQIEDKIESARVLSLVDPKEKAKYQQYQKLLLDEYGNLDPTKIVDYLKTNAGKEGQTPKSIEAFVGDSKLPKSRYEAANMKTTSINPTVKGYLLGETKPKIDAKEMKQMASQKEYLDMFTSGPMSKLVDAGAKKVINETINTQFNQIYTLMTKEFNEDYEKATGKINSLINKTTTLPSSGAKATTFVNDTTKIPWNPDQYTSLKTLRDQLSQQLKNKSLANSVKAKLQKEYDNVSKSVKLVDNVLTAVTKRNKQLKTLIPERKKEINESATMLLKLKRQATTWQNSGNQEKAEKLTLRISAIDNEIKQKQKELEGLNTSLQDFTDTYSEWL